MKTHFCLAIIATTLFSACTQNSEELAQTISNARTPITFFLGNGTRADVRDAKSIYDDGFKITICCDNAAIANNGMVMWNGNSFTTTPTAYWPVVSESAPAKFYALSCPNIPSDPIMQQEDGTYGFSYAVPAQATDQQDVLLAYGSAQAVPEDGKQALTFTHALTKVNFSVYVDKLPDNEGYVWKVSSIKLKAKSNGTCTFPTTPAGEPAWTATGELAELQYLNVNEGEQPTLQDNEKWDGQNNFMLIPQSGEELTVTLSWLVYRKTGASLVQVSQSTASKDYTISTNAWKPGVSLRYSDLRLPNIGEKVLPDENGDLDDNNMKVIDYNPDCKPFTE